MKRAEAGIDDDDDGGFGDSVWDYLLVLLIIIGVIGVFLLWQEWQIITRMMG